MTEKYKNYITAIVSTDNNLHTLPASLNEEKEPELDQ